MKKNTLIKFLALALNLVMVSSSVIACTPGGGGVASTGGNGGNGGNGNNATLETDEVYTYQTGLDLNKPLNLVENGVPQYDILVRADIPSKQLAAINEMNGFITQLTGAQLSIVKEGQGTPGDKYISVGYTQALVDAGINTSVVDYDGFVMKTIGNDFYISGDGTDILGVKSTAYQRGCIYGVYDFVERFLGVRWLTYDTTYVPERLANDTLVAYECNIESTPAFEMRQWMGGDTYFYEDFRDHCRQFTGDSWSREFGSGHNTHLYLHPTMIDPEDPEGRTFAKSHPEFFVGGNGNGTIGTYKGDEICPSSGVGDDGKLIKDTYSVAGIIASKIKAELERDADKQEIDYYFIGHNDDRSAVCNCTVCVERRAEIYDSGIWVMLLNCLEEEINTWLMATQGREVKFLHFAYQYAERPPVEEVNGEYVPINDLVICDENVGSRIAPISANYMYSFYDKNQNSTDLFNMHGWKAVCNLFMIWDYAANYEEFFWYFPNTHILKENLQFYKELGVVYMMNQSMWCQAGIWFDQMRSYISHKMYWNLGWSADDLINEFITLYYGAAAEEVKEIYKLFDDNYAYYRSKGKVTISLFAGKAWLGTNYLKIEFLNRVLTKIDSAILSVDTKEMTHGITAGQLKTRLTNIRLTPMTVILRNYTSYYTEATKLAYAKEYFDIVDTFGFKYLGEASGRTTEKRKEQYGL